MKIKNLGSNMTEVIFDNDDHILFSYETPVAGRINYELVRTSKKWSNTTSRHINKYFENEWGIDPTNDDQPPRVRYYPQSIFDERIEGRNLTIET